MVVHEEPAEYFGPHTAVTTASGAFVLAGGESCSYRAFGRDGRTQVVVEDGANRRKLFFTVDRPTFAEGVDVDTARGLLGRMSRTKLPTFNKLTSPSAGQTGRGGSSGAPQRRSSRKEDRDTAARTAKVEHWLESETAAAAEEERLKNDFVAADPEWHRREAAEAAAAAAAAAATAAAVAAAAENERRRQLVREDALREEAEQAALEQQARQQAEREQAEREWEQREEGRRRGHEQVERGADPAASEAVASESEIAAMAKAESSEEVAGREENAGIADTGQKDVGLRLTHVNRLDAGGLGVLQETEQGRLNAFVADADRRLTAMAKAESSEEVAGREENAGIADTGQKDVGLRLTHVNRLDAGRLGVLQETEQGRLNAFVADDDRRLKVHEAALLNVQLPF